MANHTLDYKAEKKAVYRGLVLLAVLTLIEVFIALLGKGFIIDGFYLPHALVAIVIIALSLYKAYFIVFEFMHMGHEVKGLAWSVILPLILLVWFVIALMYEGKSWLAGQKVNEPVDLQIIEPANMMEGSLYEIKNNQL